MRLTIVLLSLLAAVGCTPCKRSHNEIQLREGYRQQDAPTIIKTGKHSSITIPHSHWVPPHNETVWVCDEWGK